MAVRAGPCTVPAPETSPPIPGVSAHVEVVEATSDTQETAVTYHKAGDLGRYVASTSNLYRNEWVAGNGWVYGRVMQLDTDNDDYNEENPS